MTKKSLVVCGIFLAALVLYAFNLDFPTKEYYDEVYHVKTAREFIGLSGNTDTSHPPLGKLLIAAAIRLLGDKPWVWRLPSLLCGAASLALFFMLAEKLFRSTRAAFFSAFLLALDGIFMTQSRIAMLNAPMFLLMLLSLWFFAAALEDGRLRNRILSGCFLGLAGAVRWVGVGILGVQIILLANQKWLQKDGGEKRSHWKAWAAAAITAYLAAQLILPFIKGYQWSDVLTYQWRIFRYHHLLTQGHGYGSSWESWPLMIRPIWYFFERKQGAIYGIFCVGNPAVIWAALLGFVYLLYRIFFQRCRTSLFIIAGYLSQWLPWALISRVKFFHYYYTAVPFAVLGLTVLFRETWACGKIGKAATVIYAGCVLLSFAYWYPLYAGIPISEGYFQQHLWFKSWI